MRKQLLMLIGFALLLLDIRFGIISFPAFQEFRTEAPLTVDMVINHVVGSKLQIDILSNAAGFVLLILGAGMYLKSGKYEKTSKAYNHFDKIIPSSVVGLLLYLTEKFMPFALNGNLRFRCEYALYFFCLAFTVIPMGHALFGVAESMESTSYHIRNNLNIIFTMLALGCFVVSRVSYFYELVILAWIYYGISIVFAIASILRTYFDIRKKEGALNEQEG